MGKLNKIILALASMLPAGLAFGQGLEVLPNNVGNLSFVESTSSVPPGPYFEVHLNASCFRTNLRAVPAPLAEAATVTMTLDLKKNATDNTRVTAEFSSAATEFGFNGAAAINLTGAPTGTTVATMGNLVVIKVPSGELDLSAYSTSSGELDVEKARDFLRGLSFSQNSTGGGFGISASGPISGNVTTSLTTNGRILNINASFPGGIGRCNGFYSPLMMFFSDARPKFTGSSEFPLYGEKGKVAWPEAGSPGYFLVVDRNQDGKITSFEELFGQTPEKKNGFESLRVFDSNKDGKIDEQDAGFAKLMLWQDRNGDGVSQKNELEPLSKKVRSISLSYDEKNFHSMGTRVELRERSTFVFKDKQGRESQGEVVDVWFGSVSKNAVKRENASAPAAPKK